MTSPPVRILLDSDPLVICDKPPDLPSTGRRLDDPDCLQFRLMQERGEMLWAVHQLDADTSGVNLFTSRRELVEPLKQAMAKGSKRYLAIVHGTPPWSTTDCRAPIGERSPGHLGVLTGGKSAYTRIETLERGREHSLLGIRLMTGRTHQIRIHCGHLGHPLVGEGWYRDPPCRVHPRQALHAWELALGTPFDVRVRAPWPEDLARLARELGLTDSPTYPG